MTTTAFPVPLPDGVTHATLQTGDATAGQLYPEERRLLSIRATQSRIDDFSMGRAAAHLALERLGVPGSPILRGEHHEPIWPTNVVGAITHTSGYAIAATAYRSTSGGIGIDLEHRDRFFPDLAEHIATPQELSALAALDGDGAAKATLELFSAKESIYKAFFPRVGRYFGFEHAQVVFDAERNHFVGRLVDDLDPGYPSTRSFEIAHVWHEDLVLTTVVLPPDP